MENNKQLSRKQGLKKPPKETKEEKFRRMAPHFNVPLNENRPRLPRTCTPFRPIPGMMKPGMMKPGMMKPVKPNDEMSRLHRKQLAEVLKPPGDSDDEELIQLNLGGQAKKPGGLTEQSPKTTQLDIPKEPKDGEAEELIQPKLIGKHKGSGLCRNKKGKVVKKVPCDSRGAPLRQKVKKIVRFLHKKEDQNAN